MASHGGKRSKVNPDYVKWGLIVGAAVVIAVFATLIYKRYRPSVNVEAYPVRGIDVSRHNGHIEWDKVAGAGVKFVYIKASEGATVSNPLFEEQYDGARSAGLVVGCYHFFRKNRDGAAQAENFLNTVGTRTFDMPMVIDIEDNDNAGGVPDSVVILQLKAMAASLEQHGAKVMFYTNIDGYKAFVKGRLDDYDLWLGTFRDPDSVRHLGHRIQQYSHWGTVDGIQGDVDLNIFIGSNSDWERWLDDLKL